MNTRFVLALFTGLGCFAQPPVPAFEVVSIKPSNAAIPQRSMDRMQGGILRVRDYTLKDLIRLGWDVRYFQILGGPKWLDSDLYNVEAKPAVPFDIPGPNNNGVQQLRLMVQSLLSDRFNLKLHRETKEMKAYFLVVGKNGPNLTKAAGPVGSGTSMQDANGRLVATSIDMAILARELGSELGVTVLDRTGLDGSYDVKLQWNPDENASESTPDSSPSIFTAVQQLGLKLEVGKAPMEILVVDSAEKTSAN